MIQPVKFPTVKSPEEFFPTLKKRIDGYFDENGIERTMNGMMVAKLIFYIGGLALWYALLMFGGFSYGVNLVLFALVGAFCAFNGLNVCHDAIHGSVSKSPGFNKALGIIFNIVGANDYLWSIMHNNMHHTYTNIVGHDEDLNAVPILRMSPKQKYMRVHRFQQIYAFFMYSVASFMWVFVKDYKKFFQERIGTFEAKNHPKKEMYRLFFYKAVYYALFIAAPIYLLTPEFTLGQLSVGFVIMHIFEGYTLAMVFMMAHEVEGLDFPEPKDGNMMEYEWAIHQLRTTANFSTNSFLAFWFCGGLNFQIEHHLFPRICHVHYPEMSKIVKQTAEEYNIPYIDNNTFLSAIASHYRLLKQFGRDEFSYEAEPLSNPHQQKKSSPEMA